MKTIEIANIAANQLAEVVSKIDENQVEKLIVAILSANKIYVCGAGRSLYMLRAFAMRLMHLGFNSYVIGDTNTPAFSEGDLLIVGSGSGETKNVISIARRAKELKGTVAVMSIFPQSTLGKIADVVVKIPAHTDKLPTNEMNKKGILPGGSMFEESMLLLGDSIILPLAEKKNVSTDKVFKLHFNLE